MRPLLVHYLVAALLLAASSIPSQGQALRLVEKLTERVVPPDGADRTRTPDQERVTLDRRFILREPAEAARCLSQAVAPLGEEALTRRFDRLLGADDALRAEFQALSLVDRQIVVELAEEAQQVLRRHPEEGFSLLQQLDVGGLALARAYGEFVVEAMCWLQSDEVSDTLRSSRLPPEDGVAAGKTLGLSDPLQRPEVKHIAPLWKSVVERGPAPVRDGSGPATSSLTRPSG